MTTPLYYLSPTTNGTRGRITPLRALRILTNQAEATTVLEELLAEIADAAPIERAAGDINYFRLWKELHTADARRSSQVLLPDAIHLGLGACVSASAPWYAFSVGDFLWFKEDLGLVVYHIPFSKQLPVAPSAFQEQELAFSAAVCSWSRPRLATVTWTPAASSLREYSAETVLVQNEEEKSITLGQLWRDYMEPRLDQFVKVRLFPALKARGYEPERAFACPSTEFTPITNPRLTASELVRAFATAGSV